MVTPTVQQGLINDFERETALALALSTQAPSTSSSSSSSSQAVVGEKRASDVPGEHGPAKKRKVSEAQRKVTDYILHNHLQLEIPTTSVPLANEIAKVEVLHKSPLLLPTIWDLVLEYADDTLGEQVIKMVEKELQPSTIPLLEKMRSEIIKWAKKLVQHKEFRENPVAFAKKIKPNPNHTFSPYTFKSREELDARGYVADCVGKITGEKITASDEGTVRLSYD